MADYAKEWKAYRQLRNIMAVALFGIVPLSWVLHFGLSFFWNGRLSDYAVSVWFVSCFLVLVYAGVRLSLWACPRCGKTFGAKPLYGGWGIFARRCANCGLGKFANERRGAAKLT